MLAGSIDREVTTSPNHINADRCNLIQSLTRAVSRCNFDPRSKVDVIFTDSDGLAEGAVDNGGPSREFFTLLLREIQRCDLLEGPLECRTLRLSTNGMSIVITKCHFM